ncbi:hypothetical protein OAL90_01375 [Hyphomicrobiales bacterium]|nr:hypothetical protein [Hyphomicrobiales bacterium]
MAMFGDTETTNDLLSKVLEKLIEIEIKIHQIENNTSVSIDTSIPDLRD